MALEALLARYGLLAIFLGAGIEGEAVVVTGGILAHRGLVPLWAACVAAVIGSTIVDQLWFLAGRRFADHRWIAALRRQPAYARALGILERYPTAFILAFRFIYGLRTVSPIAIGTSRVPARLFVPLNILAATIWGTAFTLLGYAFGRAIAPLVAQAGHYVLIVAIGGAVVAALVFGGMRLRRARRI